MSDKKDVTVEMLDSIVVEQTGNSDLVTSKVVLKLGYQDEESFLGLYFTDLAVLDMLITHLNRVRVHLSKNDNFLNLLRDGGNDTRH